jgi:hypothetical protein
VSPLLIDNYSENSIKNDVIHNYQVYQGCKCEPPYTRPHGLKAEALLENSSENDVIHNYQGYQGYQNYQGGKCKSGSGVSLSHLHSRVESGSSAQFSNDAKGYSDFYL